MIGADVFGFETLWRQYRRCRRNKRNTVNALRFELDAETHLLTLQQELRSHTYRPGRSICFITTGPKPREVFAADFRDRVVHHLLVSQQERVFEPVFIDDSYACRKGKGTLAASDRLMVFLRRITANGQRPAWALKLDVANFFPSIDKAVLYSLIARPSCTRHWPHTVGTCVMVQRLASGQKSGRSIPGCKRCSCVRGGGSGNVGHKRTAQGCRDCGHSMQTCCSMLGRTVWCFFH